MVTALLVGLLLLSLLLLASVFVPRLDNGDSDPAHARERREDISAEPPVNATSSPTMPPAQSPITQASLLPSQSIAPRALLAPVQPTRSPSTAQRPNATLVIVNGQIRGGILCWISFKRYVLDYYKADLALIKPQVEDNPETKHWLKRARYVLSIKEFRNWIHELTRINRGNSSWEVLIENSTIVPALFGGVRGQMGSSGIILAYRHYARSFLKKILKTQSYKWVLYVRSDYVYLCSPPHPWSLSPDKIYIPVGEEYGGFTDRFTLLSAEKADVYFAMTEHLLSHAHFWLEQLQQHCVLAINIECYIGLYLNLTHQTVEQFSHVSFTVKRSVDKSRWSAGKHDKLFDPIGLLLKYPAEFTRARETCEPYNQFTLLHKTPTDDN